MPVTAIGSTWNPAMIPRFDGAWSTFTRGNAGSGATTEIGADTAAATGTTGVSGSGSAVETGADTASGSSGTYPLIYSTDFDSMTIGSPASGGIWSGTGSGPNTGGSSTILIAAAQSGVGKAMQFTFSNGNPNLCEMDFNLLGNAYNTILLDYYVWVPTNYAHASAAQENNKFFRLGHSYPVSGGAGRLGASLVRNSDGVSSDLELEWDDLYHHHSGGFDPFYTIPLFFGPSDKGTLVHVQILCQNGTALDTAQNNPAAWGVLKVWKNGTLVADQTPNNFSAGMATSFMYGYLFGATNAPYAAVTKIDIDNFAVYGQ